MSFILLLSLALNWACTSAMLPNYSEAVRDDLQTRDEIIRDFFDLGQTALEISFLACIHGIRIRLGQLKLLLRRLRCTRRQNLSDLEEVVEAVEAELKGSGSLLGYRAMHQRLVNHHRLTTTREVVLHALQIFDPEGVELRSRQRLRRRLYRCKGPNYLWHIDGYDKYSNHYD